MKRSIVLAAVSLLVGLAVGRFSQEPPANAAQAGGGTKAQLAECQASLAATQADLEECMAALEAAVGQLATVQAELAACQGNLGGYGLPATGQTKCYDDANPANEIPCDSADFPGQDGLYQAGCPSEGRFVDNGDGTVTDNCTGLMWQKDTADINGNGTIGDNMEDGLLWQEALEYCESLNFADHDDWRLPNVRELQSIVDHGRAFPAIDPIFGALATWYWTSTTDVYYGPTFAWGVYFVDGLASAGNSGFGKSYYPWYVRAVRNAP